VVAPLLFIACSGGGSPSSGLPLTAPLASLTGPQAATLCDWTNARQGGYARSVTCTDGSAEATDPDRATCVQLISYLGALCPTLTVGDTEECVDATRTNLCGIATSPACAALVACLDSVSCIPSIFIPWSIESNGVPVTCAEAGAVYVEATVGSQPFEISCLASQSFGTMEITAPAPGSYSIVMSLLDAARLDVVPPTPPLTVTIPDRCADVTTLEAVFDVQ
jgi:hypothetical protein